MEPGGSLAWFIEHSGFDAVELNARFYGLAPEKSVRSWADAGPGLRWSVGVGYPAPAEGACNHAVLDDAMQMTRFFEGEAGRLTTENDFFRDVPYIYGSFHNSETVCKNLSGNTGSFQRLSDNYGKIRGLRAIRNRIV